MCFWSVCVIYGYGSSLWSRSCSIGIQWWFGSRLFVNTSSILKMCFMSQNWPKLSCSVDFHKSEFSTAWIGKLTDLNDIPPNGINPNNITPNGINPNNLTPNDILFYYCRWRHKPNGNINLNDVSLNATWSRIWHNPNDKRNSFTHTAFSYYGDVIGLIQVLYLCIIYKVR